MKKKIKGFHTTQYDLNEAGEAGEAGEEGVSILHSTI